MSRKYGPSRRLPPLRTARSVLTHEACRPLLHRTRLGRFTRAEVTPQYGFGPHGTVGIQFTDVAASMPRSGRGLGQNQIGLLLTP